MKKFKIGDKVIGNDLADEKYFVTDKGYIGEVTDIDNEGDRIKLNNQFWVNADAFDLYERERNLPERYIINKNATILFWRDGTKTIVKLSSDDEYNKRLGFLTAYFQKNSGLSRNKANKYLEGLVEEVKTDAN